MMGTGHGVISIGIDNGLKGAVVIMGPDGIVWADTPVINAGKKGKSKNVFAVGAMVDILRGYSSADDVRAFIESAQAMPGQGVSSTFKTGLGFGLWQGICAGLDIPYEIVHPRTWTKAMCGDLPAGEPKARSMMKCQQLFPEIPLIKERGRVLSMDGRADAALIAAWGLRKMRGE